jgi:GT2 family glycosyltransferase
VGEPDVSIVIVSYNDARWLDACLSTVFHHAGTAVLEVVVVDNGSSDDTCELVASHFAHVRVVRSSNLGFGHGNNRGLERCSGRYVLFLNPDTEIIAGDFGALVALLDARPRLGLAGVRQFTADGTLSPTIRRFPNAGRALGEALGCERWRFHPAWAGERVLDPGAYDAEGECDWTTGSFMIVRREALAGAGWFDERFFLYSEEPDLCLRIKRAGWSVGHLPQMAITHHAGKGGVRPRMVAQDAFARRQYARKHFSRGHRVCYLIAVGLRHLVRAGGAGRRGAADASASRAAALSAMRALIGYGEPPFGRPPPTAIAARPRTARQGRGAADEVEQHRDAS